MLAVVAAALAIPAGQVRLAVAMAASAQEPVGPRRQTPDLAVAAAIVPSSSAPT